MYIWIVFTYNYMTTVNTTMKLYAHYCKSLPLFNLLELVYLVSHLVTGILGLLTESANLRLVLKTLLLEISTKLEEFLFTLLVEFHLGGCCTTSFIETFTELFKLTVQLGSLLLNLVIWKCFNYDLNVNMWCSICCMLYNNAMQ